MRGVLIGHAVAGANGQSAPALGRLRALSSLAACVAALVLGGSVASAATAATAVLDVKRDADTEDCADATSLERAVTARLGRQVFEAGDSADLRVSLEYSRAVDGAWHARLSVRTRGGFARGERELNTTAAHCSALDDSLALVMALMLDVSREEIAADESAVAPPSPSPPPSRPPEPAPRSPQKDVFSPTPIRLPQSTHAPRAPWRIAAGAFGQAALGNLPDPAFGAGVELVLQPPSAFLVMMEVGAWLPQTISATEGASAQLRAGAAALFVCHRWGSTASWTLCVGQRLGITDARGSGFDRNLEAQTVTYGLGMRGQFGIRRGSLELHAGPELDVPTSRGQFYYSKRDGGSGTLYTAAPVVVAAAIGLTLDL